MHLNADSTFSSRSLLTRHDSHSRALLLGISKAFGISIRIDERQRHRHLQFDRLVQYHIHQHYSDHIPNRNSANNGLLGRYSRRSCSCGRFRLEWNRSFRPER